MIKFIHYLDYGFNYFGVTDKDDNWFWDTIEQIKNKDWDDDNIGFSVGYSNPDYIKVIRR